RQRRVGSCGPWRASRQPPQIAGGDDKNDIVILRNSVQLRGKGAVAKALAYPGGAKAHVENAYAVIGLSFRHLFIQLVKEFVGRSKITGEESLPRHEVDVVKTARHALQAIREIGIERASAREQSCDEGAVLLILICGGDKPDTARAPRAQRGHVRYAAVNDSNHRIGLIACRARDDGRLRRLRRTVGRGFEAER